MQLSNPFLAALVLLGAVNCAPSGSKSSGLDASSNFDIPPGSIQVVEGLWYSNITMAGWNITDLGRMLATSANACGGCTFETRVTTASPLVEDCLRLHDNIAGEGTWTVDPYAKQQLAQYGSCAFGMDGNANVGTKTPNFYFGNEDIRDLIADSVARFH